MSTPSKSSTSRALAIDTVPALLGAHLAYSWDVVCALDLAVRPTSTKNRLALVHIFADAVIAFQPILEDRDVCAQFSARVTRPLKDMLLKTMQVVEPAGSAPAPGVVDALATIVLDTKGATLRSELARVDAHVSAMGRGAAASTPPRSPRAHAGAHESPVWRTLCALVGLHRAVFGAVSTACRMMGIVRVAPKFTVDRTTCIVGWSFGADARCADEAAPPTDQQVAEFVRAIQIGSIHALQSQLEAQVQAHTHTLAQSALLGSRRPAS